MYKLITTAACLAMFATPALAEANALPGGANTLTETHSDWTVHCFSRAETIPECAIVQQQAEQQSGQLVLAMELRSSATGLTGTMVLPFGLDLDAGIRLQIDEAGDAVLRLKTCTNVGCIVELAFDEPGRDALCNGTVLNVLIKASDGTDGKLAISLNGLSSALNRVSELTAP